MIKPNIKHNSHLKRLIIIAISGAILGIALILATLEISRENITSFVGTQEKYIISIEAAILAIFLVEILARIISYSASSTEITNYGVRLRLNGSYCWLHGCSGFSNIDISIESYTCN